MASYAASYLGTLPIISLPANMTGDSIPTDWPALPTPATNEVYLLYGATDNEANYVSVRLTLSTGTWTIDWGDGTIETGLAAGTRDHFYDYSLMSQTPTADGFKIAVVKISTSGGNITILDLQRKHLKAGLPSSAYVVNWLRLATNTPSLSRFDIGAATNGLVTVRLARLKTALIGSNSISNASYMFQNCLSLIEVSFSSSGVLTNTTSMFGNCRSLKSIPAFNTSAVTAANFMFVNCDSLQSVPVLNFSSLTDSSSMFANCTMLKSVPMFTFSVLNLCTSMFSGCSSLSSVAAFNTSTVTNMNSMFSGCATLTVAPSFNLASVTNTTNMFANCVRLIVVPAYNAPALITGTSMFSGCISLREVPTLTSTSLRTITSIFTNCDSLEKVSFSTLTGVNVNTTTPFNSCPSLTACNMTGLHYSISFSQCKLSRNAIVNIFSGLGTASGAAAITVSNNFGFADLTTGDKNIASGKGWIVN